MYSPKVVHLTNDLAAEQPLHSLTVFKKDGKLFATLLLELRSDAEKALSPFEGEELLDEHGNPRRDFPTHVYIPGPVQASLLEARSVPAVPTVPTENEHGLVAEDDGDTEDAPEPRSRARKK